jgi:hypothetical protein
MLHGYNVEEIFARRFVLVNLAYRFPIWPDQDRVHLQLLADYARVDYVKAIPAGRLNEARRWSWGMVAHRCCAATAGGHEIDTQLEFKY